jgi:hypothetical protein
MEILHILFSLVIFYYRYKSTADSQLCHNLNIRNNIYKLTDTFNAMCKSLYDKSFFRIFISVSYNIQLQCQNQIHL